MAGVALVLYASGSGVYGDLGEIEADEDHGPLVPDLDLRRQQARRRGAAGVVRLHVRPHRAGPSGSATSSGRSQTHGVGFDFVRRLLDDPTRLRILGDGRQSKSYVHVDDVIAAVLLAGATGATTPFDVFNVATGDYITVTEIAELAIEVLGLDAGRDDASSTPAATAAGRATCRWCGSTPTRSAALGWANERTGPRGAARLDAVDGRRRPRRRLLTLVTRAGRAVFLDRDGVLNAAVVRDGVPVPAARGRRVRAAARRGRGVPAPSRDAGLAAGRGHQPARHRPRGAGPAPSSTRCTTRLRARAADRRGRGLPARRRRRLLVPQAAARDDPRRRRAGWTSTSTAASGRRPLARHRGGPPGRGRDGLHRPRLRRAAAETRRTHVLALSRRHGIMS